MNKSWIIAAVLFAAFAVSAARADEPADAPDPAGPPAGALKLHALLGKWTGSGEMTQEGKETQQISIVMNCVETAGGWGIRCDDAMTGKEMNYLETDIMGFDAAQNNVHWYAVTNAGEVHDHVAQWSGDSTFVANYTSKAGTRTISEDITMNLTSPTEMEAKSSVSVDGKAAQSLTMKLSKPAKKEKSR